MSETVILAVTADKESTDAVGLHVQVTGSHTVSLSRTT